MKNTQTIGYVGCLLIAILGLITPTMGGAMSLFGFGKICAFSELSGQVLLNEKPVSGVEIIRSFQIDSKKKEDSTTTDAQGYFSFPAAYTSSVNKFLPVEPGIKQRIVIHHQGQEYLAWQTTKRNYDENGELKKPIKLRCELTEEIDYREEDGQVIQGLCVWE